MGTEKYDLHEIEYSTQGWDAILNTDMQKLDDVIPSRIIGTLGETVVAYQCLYLKPADEKWYKALSDGTKQGAVGLAIEGGDADEEIRIHKVGEITNGSWAWAENALVYIDASTSGALTQTAPSNAQAIGYAISATTIFVFPSIPLGSLLALQENQPIQLVSALSEDGKFSGIAEAGVAGTALAFGDLVYLAVADSKWELADASAEATAIMKIGICVLAASEDDPTLILLWGKVRADTEFPDLTIGAPVYMSEDLGNITVTAPVASGAIVRIIGYGNTANELFFCPSNDWVGLA